MWNRTVNALVTHWLGWNRCSYPVAGWSSCRTYVVQTNTDHEEMSQTPSLQIIQNVSNEMRAFTLISTINPIRAALILCHDFHAITTWFSFSRNNRTNVLHWVCGFVFGLCLELWRMCVLTCCVVFVIVEAESPLTLRCFGSVRELYVAW